MAWLNVETLRIPERRIVLQIPRPVMLADKSVFEAIHSRDPLAVEAVLRALVLASRPELACCVIDFVGYDQRSCCFEIGVSHPSLAIVPLGGNSPKEPLDLDNWLPGRKLLESS